jgi:glycosyltransferase involved in cell wall biosynthesis
MRSVPGARLFERTIVFHPRASDNRFDVMRPPRLEPFTILHVVAPATFGGLEQVVHSLAAGQQSRGSSVHVAALVGLGAPEPMMISPLRAAGVTVHALAFPGRAYRAQLMALRDLCARVSPDVIHTHGYLPDFLGALLPRSSRRAALVTTVHGFTGGGWKNRLYEVLERQAFRRFDAVVAVSRKLERELAPSGDVDGLIRAIPNACPPTQNILEPLAARQSLDVPEGVFSIGWVGRISHEKGLDILIEALARLADLPLRLTVVGAGSDRDAIQSMAQQRGLSPHVIWAGVVPEAARLLRAFDLLIISSRSEGTPIILLEAMNAGVPIVTTAVGGIPDVVSSSQALLVDPNPSAIADAIREVYRNPRAASQRAALARERFDSISAVDPWLDRYTDVYVSARERLLEKRAV